MATSIIIYHPPSIISLIAEEGVVGGQAFIHIGGLLELGNECIVPAQTPHDARSKEGPEEAGTFTYVI
jgi:hypothetical protein